MMARFCSNCGKELNENADICLNCGVGVNNGSKTTNVNNGKKKGMPGWGIALIIIVCVLPIVFLGLLMVLSFSSVKNSVNRAREMQRRNSIENSDSYNIIEKGSIGDTLEYNGLRFTLNKVNCYDYIGNNTLDSDEEYIVFFLDVENVSDEVKSVSMVNFKGINKFDTEEPEILIGDVIDGINNFSFGKRLSVGDKVSGYVVFETEKYWIDYDLVYRDFFDNTAISFSVTNDMVSRA